MITVCVRSLQAGRRAEVTCQPHQTLRQLKRQLAERDAAFASCKLFLRGKPVDDVATVDSLSLQPGEFMVAIGMKRQSKANVTGGAQLADGGTSSSIGSAAVAPGTLALAAAVAVGQQGGGAGLNPQPALSGGGFCRPPQPPACPGSPRCGQPAASHSAMPSSPAQLDSLLPGYLSRPNPSPMKARRLAHLPARLAQMHDMQPGPPQPGPAVPPGATLLQLAAARFAPPRPLAGSGGGDMHDAGDTSTAAAGGAAAEDWVEAAAGAAEESADLPPSRPQPAQPGDRSGPAVAPAAAAAVAAPSPEDAVMEEAAVATAAAAALDSDCIQGRPAPRPEGRTRSLWEDLHQELLAAQQAGQQEDAQQAQQRDIDARAAIEEPGSSAGTTGRGRARKRPRADAGEGSGRGSKSRRGGHRSGRGGGAAGAAGATGPPAGPEAEQAAGQGEEGPEALRPGLAAGGLLGDLVAFPPETLARLPLPPAAAELERGFGVVAAVHAFLAQQHIQASWKNVRESLAGAGLEPGQGAPSLEEVQLMAALCPWMVSLKEHMRLAGRPYREPWKGRREDEERVESAVAAAAALEAAGCPGPIPHPMQVRTDGAGTVLEGDPDTHVLEVADPGRGFSKVHPIPACFLAQLCTAGALGIPRDPGIPHPQANINKGGAGEGASPVGAAEEDSEVEAIGSEEGGVPGAMPAAATAAAAGKQAQRGGRGGGGSKQRENPRARQAWAFRLALLRALRWLEREHSAAQQAQQPTGPVAVADTAQPEGTPPAAFPGAEEKPEQEPPPARLTRRRAALQRSASGPAAATAAAAAAGAGAAGGQPGTAKEGWCPGFAAALPAVSREDLQRAALALQDEAQAAEQQRQEQSAPMDALGAARAAAAAQAAAAEAGGAGGGPSGGSGQGTGGSRGGAGAGVPRPPTIMKNHEPCRDTTEMGTEQFLEHLQSLPWYSGQAVHCERMPSRQAQHAEPAVALDGGVLRALRARGVGQLFSHQARAVELLMQGRHTVIATSTASGKSLCYNLPILQALAGDPGACALYIFPTKALAQDQLRALRELTQQAFGERAPHVDIYDGDTPMGDRPAIRDRAQLLITNPDMLHMSVLPVHRQFGRLLANLKYVVVDEGHSYKGVFGCHTALVLRRLRRLCERLYASSPTFVVTTATVANPREHACALLGVEEVDVITEDGSPHGPKCFVLWNPPLISAKGGKQVGQGARGRTRAPGKRALEEQVRSQVREATQERGRGSQLGGSMGEGQWVAAVKLGRRRAAVEAAALEALAGSARSRAQQAQQAQQEGQAGAAGSSGGEGGSSEVQALAGAASCVGGAASAAAAPAGAEAAAGGAAAAASAGAEQDPSSHSSRAPQQAQQGLGAAPAPAHASPAAAMATAVAPAPPAPSCSQADSATAAPDLSAVINRPPPGPVRPLIRRHPWGFQHLGHGQRQGQGQHWSGRIGRGGSMQAGHRPAQGSDTAGAAGGAERQGGSTAGAREGGEGDPGEVQSRLPTSAAWKARGGAAGTPQDLRRSSPIVELSMLLAECVQHGLRTIAFCHTRKLCELVAAYVREMLRASAPALEGSISVYRAGYSPGERREIERALFQGQLRAVAATNALELGIDVGSLDVTLHLGFPGSVASLWQQAGRAGRREQASMSIYVAWDGPLDQYFMHQPERLFSRPIEKAQLDPRNPGVLEGHLACAAAEAPLLLPADEAYFGEGLGELAAGLMARGLLGRHPDSPQDRAALHYVGTTPNPASKLSLRAIDPERFTIVNEAAGGEVVEEIEASKAFYEVYDGAVYMFQGRTYLCKKLDLGARVAVVRPADLKYYTTCVDFTDVHVTGGKVAFPPKALASGQRDSSASCGEAVVTVRWLGFNRVWRGSGVVFDTVDLFLPDVQFQTEAAYIRVPPSARQRLKAAGLPFREGLHAASHALLNVLPLYLMSNPNDVGTECDNAYDTRFRPERLLIFDRHPGGIGLAAAACPIFGELLLRALELVERCDCCADTGCPGCVQHTCCGEYNTVLHKRSGAVVLRAMLEAEGLLAEEVAQAQPGEPEAGPGGETRAAQETGTGGNEAPEQAQQQRRRQG